MKTKLGLMWRVLITMALVSSLGFVFSAPAAAVAPDLDVAITLPTTATEVHVGTNFAVTAEVTNNGDAIAQDVDVTLTIDGNASLDSGALTYNVGDISPGSTQEINWTVHCDGVGDVYLTATATEVTGGVAESNTVYVRQLGLESLNVTITPPPQEIQICPCTDFTVEALVENDGDVTITNIGVTLSTMNPHASVVGSATQVIGSLARGASQTLTWTMHCDGAITGADCLDDMVDVTVAALGDGPVGGVDSVSDSGTISEFRNQKWIIVEIIEPLAYKDICVGDEFFVNATVQNCYDEDVEGTVKIWPSGIPADVNLESQPDQTQSMIIPAGETRTIPLKWHVTCTGAGDVDIEVKFLGIAPPGQGATLCDTDSITIYQRAGADLECSIDAAPNCVCRCSDITVTADISNTGDTAATGVQVTLTPSGDVSTTDPLTVNVGTIAAGDSVPLTWTFHCDGPIDATFSVRATGTDAVCGGTVTDTCSDSVTQVGLEVQIIAPDDGITYSSSQTFCVTAELTNLESHAITLSGVVIDTGATASLLSGEADTKLVGDTIEAGQTEQASWTVHCDGSGDSLITVTANVDYPCSTACADAITIDQEERAALEIMILSPFDYSYVATSQDYAVTAQVTNTGEAAADDVAVTLTPDANATVTDPTQTVTIAGGTSEVLTWTVHCDASGDPVDEIGDTIFTVSAVGVDHNSGDEVTAGEQTVTVTQYAVAHLEVEITGISPSTIYIGDVFDVSYTVTNTGESDAWEVSAVLSVTPEGSARVAEGEGGYTQSIGTLQGHGQDGSYQGTFVLQCKEVCATTITITAQGFDEKGYHFKQVYVVDQWVDPIAEYVEPVCEQWVQIEVEEGVFDTFCVLWTEGYWVTLQEGYWLEGGGWMLNLVPEAGRAIDARFIEPDSETVKQLEVSTAADLAITKEADESTVTVRDPVVFTITVTNNGPAEATGVRVTDVLPAGVNYESSSASQGWYDVTSGVWAVGNLAASASATLDITATVNALGEIANVAEISAADQADPNTANNSDMVTITGDEAPPVTEATITLDQGYNLISLQLIPQDPAIEAVLDDVLVPTKVDKVTMYDASVPAWYSYTPGAPSDLTTMEDGWGYWMDMNEAGDFTFAGWELVAETDPPSLPPSYDVVNGWNLIGFKSTVPKTPADYLAGIAGRFVMIYGYDNGAFFIAGSAGHEYLQPGLGYWIAVVLVPGETGTIYP